MPCPPPSPGRAGDVVPRIFCWPQVAWRTRLLATALRSGEQDTHAIVSKSVQGVKYLKRTNLLP